MAAYKVQKNKYYWTETFYDIINVLTVTYIYTYTFDQLNGSLMNKSDKNLADKTFEE